jgi:hypothetical protein
VTVQERKKQIRIVAEMLLVHLPAVLEDQELARDLLCVVGIAIRAAEADAEKSAAAWDKRAYHLKADDLRRQWAWAAGAGNYALGLANRPQPLKTSDLKKLRELIGIELERPKRLKFSRPEAFRGACAANRQRERREKRRIPKRSLV